MISDTLSNELQADPHKNSIFSYINSINPALLKLKWIYTWQELYIKKKKITRFHLSGSDVCQQGSLMRQVRRK